MQTHLQKIESTEPVLRDSPLSIPVSLYRKFSSQEPATVNLLTLLTTDSYQPRIEALRAMVGAEQDAAKKQLPCYTIGGVFQGGHSAGNRIEASKLIGIDLDFKDNANVQGFDNLKAACRQVPFILYCGLSCRGKGYLVIMALKYPDKFLQQFRALQSEFKRFGLTIDEKCSNPNRLRFVSYDASPYINHSAIPFSLLYEEKKVLPPAFKKTAYRAVGNSTPKDVEQLVNEIVSRNIDITIGYDNWLSIGFAFSTEFGEAGRIYFHSVSQISTQYKYEEADRQYSSCLRSKQSGVTIKSFFHLCKQSGIVAQRLVTSLEKNDLKRPFPNHFNFPNGNRMGNLQENERKRTFPNDVIKADSTALNEVPTINKVVEPRSRLLSNVNLLTDTLNIDPKAPNETRSNFKSPESQPRLLANVSLQAGTINSDSVAPNENRTQVAHKENWTHEINSLFDFYEPLEGMLPAPIRLNQCTMITNPAKFIEGHFQTIVSNHGSKKIRPFIDRMIELKILIENNKHLHNETSN